MIAYEGIIEDANDVMYYLLVYAFSSHNPVTLSTKPEAHHIIWIT